MKQYMRIQDKPGSDFDGLEQACNILAKEGWELFKISDGSTFRAATLVRDVPTQPTEKEAKNVKRTK